MYVKCTLEYKLMQPLKKKKKYGGGVLRAHYDAGLHAPRSGGKRDGSSIFYRSDRFVCHAFEAVDFSQVGLRENAAAIACLQPIAPQQPSTLSPQLPPPPIIVGCIHVLFNPKRGDHKLGQLRVLIERIEAQRSAAAQRRIKEWDPATSALTEQLAPPELPEPQVMMTGDFNAEPDSPLYHFLATVRGKSRSLKHHHRLVSPPYRTGWRRHHT